MVPLQTVDRAGDPCHAGKAPFAVHVHPQERGFRRREKPVRVYRIGGIATLRRAPLDVHHHGYEFRRMVSAELPHPLSTFGPTFFRLPAAPSPDPPAASPSPTRRGTARSPAARRRSASSSARRTPASSGS